ncbi:uncharacterized protein G2W53_037109 [Senna tora]|uniref:Uncharacterized protein n=1 Tax=Senna tora TaxID=362788 RepID=A0A834W9B8_9FABA|nr:uncharacterized protein G2W53_037109 [Senna tora]
MWPTLPSMNCEELIKTGFVWTELGYDVVDCVVTVIVLASVSLRRPASINLHGHRPASVSLHGRCPVSMVVATVCCRRYHRHRTPLPPFLCFVTSQFLDLSKRFHSYEIILKFSGSVTMVWQKDLMEQDLSKLDVTKLKLFWKI